MADPSGKSAFISSIQAMADECKINITIGDVKLASGIQSKIQSAIDSASHNNTVTVNNVKVGKVDASAAVSSVKNQLSTGLKGTDLSNAIKIDASAFTEINKALTGITAKLSEFNKGFNSLDSTNLEYIQKSLAAVESALLGLGSGGHASGFGDFLFELSSQSKTAGAHLEDLKFILGEIKYALTGIDGVSGKAQGFFGYFDGFADNLDIANSRLERMLMLVDSISSKDFRVDYYGGGGLSYGESDNLNMVAKGVQAIAEKIGAVKSALSGVSAEASGGGVSAVTDGATGALQALAEMKDAIVGIRDALLGVGDSSGVFAQIATSMQGLIGNAEILVGLLDTVKNSKFNSAKSAAAAELKYSGLKEAKQEALAYYNVITQMYQDLTTLPNYVSGNMSEVVRQAFGGYGNGNQLSNYAKLVREFSNFAYEQSKSSGALSKINSAKTTSSLDAIIYQYQEIYNRLKSVVGGVNAALQGVSGAPTITIDDSQIKKAKTDIEGVAAAGKTLKDNLADVSGSAESAMPTTTLGSIADSLQTVRDAIVGIRDALLGVDEQQGVFATFKTSMDELVNSAKAFAEQLKNIKTISVDADGNIAGGSSGKKPSNRSKSTTKTVRDGVYSQVTAEFKEFEKAYKSVLSQESTALNAKNLGGDAVTKLEELKLRYVEISDAITNLATLSGDARNKEINRISEEIAKANEEVAVMRQLAEAKKEADKQTAASQKEADAKSKADSEKAYKVEVAAITERIKALDSVYKSLEKQEGGSLGSESLGEDAVQRLSRIRDLYNEIKTAITNLATLSGDARTQEIARINGLIDSMNNETAAYAVLTATKRDADTQAAKDAASAAREAAAIDNQSRAVQNLIASMETFRKSSDKVNNKFGERISGFIDELNTPGLINGRFKEIQAAFSGIKAEASSMGQTLGDKIKSAISSLSSFGIATRAFSALWQGAKDVTQNVTEIDAAMAQLKIVTSATDNTMQNFLINAITLSKELGTSVTDILGSIETFARLGYDIEDATHLSEFATILSNVGAVEVDEATTGMTSIIKGFGLDVSEAEHVADVLIEVGQKYAISAGELMEGFERAGAALNATDTSFEKSAALLAAGNAATQNAETVGTALKAISARIRGATTELEDMGESTDDLAQGFSKYRDELLSLTGFDIMENVSTGDYKDLYDIFIGISEVWNDLSDTTQARVAEILGGTRQLSIISSIFTNISDATGSYEAAMNSAGVATKSNAIYMDTIEARVGTLSATFQEMSTNLLNSDTAKFVLDLADGFLSVANALAKVNAVLPTIISLLLSTKNINWFSVNKDAVKGRQFQIGGVALGDLMSGEYSLKSIFNNKVDVSAVNDYNAAFQKNYELAESLFPAYSNMQKGMWAQGVAVDSVVGSYGKLNQSTLDLIKSANGAAVSQDKINEAMKSTSSSSFGASLAAAACSAALNALIGIGISYAIKGIDALINRTENLISAGEAARETVSSITSEFESNASTIESISDSYAKLAQGVNQSTWENESLSTEDYDEFLGIANQIGEMLPEHVRYFDAEGNAVLDLAGDTDTLTASLEELIAQMREAANVEIAEQLDDIFKGSAAQVSEYKSEINDLNVLIRGLVRGELYNNAESAELLSKYGIGYALGGEGLSAGQILELDTANYSSQIYDAVSQLQAEREKLESKIASEYSSLGQYFYSWLSTDSNFVMLADDVRNALQEVVYNINWSDLGIDNADDAKSWITDNLTKGLAAVEDVMDAYSGALDMRTLFESGEASYADYKGVIDGLVSALKASALSDEVKSQVGAVFGDLFNVDDVTPQVNKIKNVLSDELEGYVEGMSLEDIEIGYEIVADAENGGMSVEEFEAKVDELRNTKIVASFSIKDYETDIDNLQSDLKTLKSALENIESGDIEADDVIDLVQEFPTLLDSLDSSEEGFTSLTGAIKRMVKSKGDKFIEEMTEKMEAFKEAGDDAGAKGIESLIKLMEELGDTSETALDGAIDQFGEFEKSVKAAEKAYSDFQSVIDASEYEEGFEQRVDAYDEMMELYNKGWDVHRLRGYMDYLGIEGDSRDDIEAWSKKYGKLYTTTDEGDFSGVYEFFQMLQKIQGEVNGLSAIETSDGWSLEYDNNEVRSYVDALNKEFEGMDWTAEMFTDFLRAISGLTADWENTSLDDYMKQVEGTELNLTVGEETYSDLDKFIAETKGYYGDTLEEIEASFAGAELEMPQFVDTEAVKNAADIADDGLKMATALADAGVNAKTINDALVSGDFSNIEAITNGLGLGEEYAEKIVRLLQGAYLDNLGVEELKDALLEIEGITPEIQNALETGDYTNLQALLEEFGFAKENAEQMVEILSGTILPQGTTQPETSQSGAGEQDVNTVEEVSVTYAVENAETLTEPIEEAQAYADSNPISVNINAESATETITGMEERIAALDETEASPHVLLKGVTTVFSRIASLRQKLEALSKNWNININVNGGTTVSSGKKKTSTNGSKRGATDRTLANAAGTSNFAGGVTLLGDEYSPTGDPRPELVVDNGEAFVAGLNGPEFQELGKGAVIYKYSDTKRILRNSSIKGKVPAFSGGSGGSSWKNLTDGSSGSTTATTTVTASTTTTASTYEDAQKELEHLLNMHLISYQEYYNELAAMEEKYHSEIHADNETLWEYQESLFSAAEQAFDDVVDAADHSATMAESAFSDAARDFDYESMYAAMTQQLNAQKQIMDAVEQRIKELADAGVDENDSAMRELREQWQSAYESFADIADGMEDEIRNVYSESLDEVQGVYDTLIDASEEFAQNGYITVDTFQAICDMGVQYIKYLQDENGAITFNEEAIQRLIQAKVQDMAVTQANLLIDTIETYIAEGKALETLAYATDVATESTWALVYARLANLDLSDDLYNAFASQIRALQSLSVSAQQSVTYTRESASDLYQEQNDALESILDLIMDMVKSEVEDHMDALEDQKDAMQDLIDERKEMLDLQEESIDYEKQLADYTQEIAELQFKINQLSLDDSREAQAERAQLISELAELQGEATDYQTEHWKDKTEEALDDQYDAYEENIDKQIEALEDSISSQEKIYQLAVERIKSTTLAGLYNQLREWNYEQGDLLESELIEKWQLAAQAAQQYGGILEAIAATQAQINASGSNVIGSSVGTADQSAGEQLSAADKSIVEQMKANSRAWYTVETDKERSALQSANASLASQLSQKYTLNSSGLWANAKGNVLYTRESWFDSSLLSQLVNQMKTNSASWNSASASRQKELANWNVRMAQYVATLTGKKVTRDSNGVWWIGNEELFKKYHEGGIVESGDLKSDEVVAVLRKGEMVLTDEMQSNLSSMVDLTSYFMEKASELSKLVSGNAGLDLAESLFKGAAPSASTVENSQSINLVVNVNVSGNMTDDNYNDFADKISRQVSEKMSDAFYRKGIRNSTARAMLRG